MSDIRTIFVDMEHGMDYAIESMLLANDDGLTTALMLSLFTDRRAGDDDVLPPGVDDLRGVWMDSYAEVPGDLMGSRLWLLQRAKLLPETVMKVREYCEEALDWMVGDGMAKSVQVSTWIERRTPVGVIGAQIDITKPDGTTTRFKFDKLWSAM
ncbi:MAG: phage GP46 family protein [Pseudomonadota bacterium]